MAKLRLDEQRATIKGYFETSLASYKSRVDADGLPYLKRISIENTIEFHEDAETEDGCDELSRNILNPEFEKRFREQVGMPAQDWADNEESLRIQLRLAHRDMLKEVLSYAEQYKHFDFSKANKTDTAPPKDDGVANLGLGQAVADFMQEYQIGRSQEMIGKVTNSLAILIEMFGPSQPISGITRQDVGEVRKVLQAYPKARNTKPKTRGLSLEDALAVEGVETISLKTANEHIQSMRLLWTWSKQMGFVQDDLFEGMKFKIAKGVAKQNNRDAFTPEQTQRIYDTLLSYSSGRSANSQKDLDRKWGSLIGLFTGARRTEIGQLYVEDIRQDEGSGIWYIDFNENGPDKSLKTEAGQRHVPLHDKLIENGFLEFVDQRRAAGEKKLFPSFTYHAQDGCGRNLGRFFNENFLPSLGLKRPGLVFHSFRHTMVHRLVNVGVPQAICQAIVGHEREGVTEKHYNKGGYSLEICKDALDKFSIA